MPDRLHLSRKHRRILETLFREHLPDVEVWAYGSRVNGRSHDGSDLDLVLRGSGLEEIPIGQVSDFWDAVSESSIPFLVEARDWARLPDRFRREIERQHVELCAPCSRPSCRWQKARLGDVIRLRRGHDLPKRLRVAGSFPVVSSSGISDSHAKAKVQGPGVIIGRYGTLGEVHFVRSDYWPLNTTLYVEDFNGNDPRYVSYLLETLDVSPFSDKAAVPGLNRNHLHEAEVPFAAPAAEQRAIAHILGTLDDKIELNRRENETLEAMARALFKDWFVDFGPIRAKAEGKQPYLSPGLWGMFPGALGDQGIPIGWAREDVGHHVVAEKGLSYKGAGLTAEGKGAPLHNLNSILEGGGYKNEGLKFYRGDYKPRHIVRPGDLIVANTEQGFDHLLIGYSSMVPAWIGEEGLFSHHLFKVQPRPGSPISTIWFHFAVSASSFGEVVRRYSNGTTVNMLPRDALERPEITVPPAELIQAFGKIVLPMIGRMEGTFTESQVLTQLRDVLLPKLISGEIQASQAERVVEAATSSDDA